MTLKRASVVLMSLLLVATVTLSKDKPKDNPSAADTPQKAESKKPFAAPLAKSLGTKLAIQYQFDFRDGKFDRERLIPVGNLSLYSWSLLKPEPRGLRITIPWHQGKEKPTLGIAPAFTIHGDFQITAGYELVAADTPKTGGPVGGQIYIMAQKTRNGASILRGVMPGGRQVYYLFWAVRDATGRKPAVKAIPTESRRGKLRFVRTGEMLHFLVAEEGSNEFRELAEVEFGREPIGLFRAESITNGAPCTAETLWNGIEIRAEKVEPIKIPLHATNNRAFRNGSEKTALKSKE